MRKNSLLWRSLLLAAALNLVGCSAMYVQSERPDMVAPRHAAVGGTVGLSPEYSAVSQNYPPASSPHEEVEVAANVNYGLARDFDVGAYASYLITAIAAGARIRYRWLEPTKGGWVSTASLGVHSESYAAYDFLASIPGSTESIDKASFSSTGVSLANSVGYAISPSFKTYFGPKVFYIRANGEYTHSVSQQVDRYSYTGPIFGGFLGGSYTFIRRSTNIVLDLMGALYVVPPNLRDGSTTLAPAISLTLEFEPGTARPAKFTPTAPAPDKTVRSAP